MIGLKSGVQHWNCSRRKPVYAKKIFSALSRKRNSYLTGKSFAVL